MLSEADKRWKKSPKGIASRKKYDRSPVGKAKYARYRATDSYRKYIREYWHKLPINVRKARYYIHNAIRDGKIKRSEYCEKCGTKDWGIKRSMIEAHHYKGYEPQNWLSVQWLCTNCHREVM